MEPKVVNKQSNNLNNENVLQCDFCHFKFKREIYSKKHKRYNSACNVCHKSFGCFVQLRREHKKCDFTNILSYKVSTVEEAWAIRRRWIEHNCSPEEIQLAALAYVSNSNSDNSDNIVNDIIPATNRYEKENDTNTAETNPEKFDNKNGEDLTCDVFREPEIHHFNRYYNKASQMEDFSNLRTREHTKNKVLQPRKRLKEIFITDKNIAFSTKPSNFRNVLSNLDTNIARTNNQQTNFSVQKVTENPKRSKDIENSPPKLKSLQSTKLKNPRKLKRQSEPIPTVLNYIGLQRRRRFQRTFKLNNKKREKCFSCAICQEVFYHKVNLIKHKVKKHLKPPFIQNSEIGIKPKKKGNIMSDKTWYRCPISRTVGSQLVDCDMRMRHEDLGPGGSGVDHLISQHRVYPLQFIKDGLKWIKD